MIVALAGRSRSGKDTVAAEMVALGFRRVAFATSLKALCGHVFGYPDAVLWGEPAARDAADPRAADPAYWLVVRARLGDASTRTAVARLFARSPDVRLERAMDQLASLTEERFAPRGGTLTARYVLQLVGTEWGRALWDRVWLEAARATIEDGGAERDWVITDCRFANEARFVVESLGGRVVWVDASRRLPPPDPALAHASEPRRADLEPHVAFDLDNNGTRAELTARVRAAFAATLEE
jgi:hypothetical protein